MGKYFQIFLEGKKFTESLAIAGLTDIYNQALFENKISPSEKDKHYIASLAFENKNITFLENLIDKGLPIDKTIVRDDKNLFIELLSSFKPGGGITYPP